MNKDKYNGAIINGDIRTYSINMLDFSGVMTPASSRNSYLSFKVSLQK